jgi:hypothetical protein
VGELIPHLFRTSSSSSTSSSHLTNSSTSSRSSISFLFWFLSSFMYLIYAIF